ncbi:MAG: hypothetical protein KUF78_17310 [Candidatus Thiodiazotropha sp. (ex Lucina aurantia)]|nr:hypothetical protein [Candidatus Thiodiazotropha sp. (ex Codakia orbicularis)]MBV2119191.1 hypothetical protein [Candidatus Thiodiazotropha sp. (ex Lucina aurantia)]MCG8058994.1 hypothetical protein [Candidatus Thiodiazotropha taylori]
MDGKQIISSDPAEVASLIESTHRIIPPLPIQQLDIPARKFHTEETYGKP